MKAFIFDLVHKLQRTSNTLDAKTILCNKTWRVFSDTGEKEVYIFMEDGKLIISSNGIVEIGTWLYVPANQSLVITGKQNYLVHPVICNNILTLIVDGTNQCAFLLDDTKKELEMVKSLQGVSSYISTNMNLLPCKNNNSNQSSAFIFGDTGEYRDGSLFLDIRQMKRRGGYAQNGLYYSPYNDFGILQGSIWVFSPDYKENKGSTFGSIFTKDGVLIHMSYTSFFPNGEKRCWLVVNWFEKTRLFSREKYYIRDKAFNIPGRGMSVNELIDEHSWMNKFGDYLKADLNKYCKLLQNLFGVNPISTPFWTW